MADFFVDQGAYGAATNRLGLDTPAWGVPQEGDGSSKYAAVTAAAAAVLLTAQPAANDTLSIAGQVFTAIATAPAAGSANYQIGGTLQLTADNLAASINGCTQTAISALLVNGTPQTRNILFARSTVTNAGTAANTVEIMCRIGCTKFNYVAVTNTSPQIVSSVWSGGSPTLTQFSGGVGGCWGWLVNDAIMGVAGSIAFNTYGIGQYKPYVFPGALTTLTLNDWVYMRSGTGRTIDLGTGNNWNRGAVGFPLNLVVDSNTKWTEDTGSGVITVKMKAAAAATTAFKFENSSSPTNFVLISAKKKGGFKIEWDLSNTSATFEILCAGFGRLHNVEITEKLGVVGNSSYMRINMTGSSGAFFMTSCVFNAMNVRPALYTPIFFHTNQNGNWSIEDCDFNLNLNGSQSAVDAVGVVNTQGINGLFRIYGCRFTTNSITRFKWFHSAQPISYWLMAFDRNVGVTVGSAGTAIQQAPSLNRSGYPLPSLMLSSADTGMSMRHELTTGISDWDYEAGSFPYLAAVQPDGTPYSVRMTWFAGYIAPSCTFSSPKNTLLNRLAAGVRTIAMEFLSEPGRVLDETMIGIQVNYVDTTGKTRRDSTYLVQAPTTSTAPWVFRGTNFNTYLPKKLTVTTSQPVMQNSTVEVELIFFNQPSGSGNTQIFYDPEFSLI